MDLIFLAARWKSAFMVTLLGYLLLVAFPCFAEGHEGAGPPKTANGNKTIQQKVAGMKRYEGFLPFYWDPRTGELLLEITEFDKDILYVVSLATGTGSVLPRLDRGMIKIGSEALVRFHRVGSRVFLIQINTKFRALDGENGALVRSVEDSFPQSVLASFSIEAEDHEKVLVGTGGFFFKDAFGLRQILAEARQGDFRLDATRSAIYLPRTRNFPHNTEVEAMLTFSSEDPGPLIQQNTPNAQALTLRVHHSLAALPDPGYRPRPFDPRVGLFPLAFRDYAQRYDQDVERRWIMRRRLEKADPNAALSKPKKPIVYFLDSAIPEPTRSAVRDGVLWWNRAFEAAGFKDSIEVKDLPPDADPLDIRYSVIEWVHRSQEGFANGPFLTDPRTGEILKAAIRLHSDRMRIDSHVWSGLFNAAWEVSEVQCAVEDWGLYGWPGLDFPSEQEFILARIRLLAAHEVGHTLGLEHNFVGSTYGRASVMDYPAPLVRISKGQLDLSQAYAQGIGDYDRFAIQYAYSTFPSESEEDGLHAIIREALSKKLLFIAEGDGGFNPRVNPWDNGADPVEALKEALDVRAHLLDRFGESVLKPGQPIGLLLERLVPVYLYHRFALDRAIKVIGGMEFTYAMKDDGQIPSQLTTPDQQRQSLKLLLDAIQPDALLVPPRLLPLLAPRPFGYNSTAQPFDQVATARMLAAMILGGLLDRERANRLIAFADREENPFTFQELVGEIIKRTWCAGEPNAKNLAKLQRLTQGLVVEFLIELVRDPKTSREVREIARWQLKGLEKAIETKTSGDPLVEAHLQLSAQQIRETLSSLNLPVPSSLPTLPPANLTGSH